MPSYCTLLLSFISLATVVEVVHCLAFKLDSENPFPLTNTLKNIRNMVQDGQGRIWGIFTDGSVIRYSQDLDFNQEMKLSNNRSVVQLTFHESSSIFWNSAYSILGQLTTKEEDISYRVASVIGVDQTEVLVCDLENLTILEVLNLRENVISNRIFPFKFTPYGQGFIHIIVTNQSVFAIFASETTEIIHLNNSTSVTAGTILGQKWLSNQTQNCMGLTYKLFLGLGNGSVLSVDLQITLNYDSISNNFALLHSSIVNVLYRHSYSVGKFFFMDDCLVSQDSKYITRAYDYIKNKAVTLSFSISASNIYLVQLYEIVVVQGKYYWNFPLRYLQMSYDSTNSVIRYVSRNNYTCFAQGECITQTVIGTNLSFAYRTNGFYLFKLSLCNGEYSYSNSTCEKYACDVSQCKDCSLSPQLCSYCSLSFLRGDNLTSCEPSPISCIMDNCIDCANNTCFTCEDNYFIINHVCQPDCNVSSCLSCQIPNVCSECHQSYILSNGNCTFAQQLSQDVILNLLSCNFLSSQSSRTSCQQYLNNEFAYYSLIINKYLMSTPFLSQAIGWLSPLFIFNNDYWYYMYHNRTYDNLLVTNIFFEIISQINNQRMFPFFVDETNQIENNFDQLLKDTFYKDTTNYTEYKVVMIDQKSTLFLVNIHTMLLWNYSWAFSLVIGFKIIGWVVDKMKDIKSTSRIVVEETVSVKPLSSMDIFVIKMRQYFKENSSASVLFVSLVQANAVFICFYAGLQIKLLFQFMFVDKLNLIFCINFLFICLFSGCVFYSLLWGFSFKLGHLIEDKKLQSSSFYYTNAVILIRNSVYGFIQATFIDNYKVMMLLLIALKIGLLICYFRSRYFYKFQTLAIFNMSYVLFGLLYDIYLLSSYLSDDNFFGEKGYIIELIILGGIILSVICLMLALSLKSMHIVFKRCCESDLPVESQSEASLPKTVIFQMSSRMKTEKTVQNCGIRSLGKMRSSKSINRRNRTKSKTANLEKGEVNRNDQYHFGEEKQSCENSSISSQNQSIIQQKQGLMFDRQNIKQKTIKFADKCKCPIQLQVLDQTMREGHPCFRDNKKVLTQMKKLIFDVEQELS